MNTLPVDPASRRNFLRHIALLGGSALLPSAAFAAAKAGDTLPDLSKAGLEGTVPDIRGKVVHLDFWASWCGPCMNLMPALKKKAAVLAPHGIVVAAMNKDDDNAEATAERIRGELNATLPWLIEPPERPYSKALEITSIPRMILLSPTGKVLFNGHPEDPALWVALKKIDPAIEAPTP